MHWIIIDLDNSVCVTVTCPPQFSANYYIYSVTNSNVIPYVNIRSRLCHHFCPDMPALLVNKVDSEQKHFNTMGKFHLLFSIGYFQWFPGIVRVEFMSLMIAIYWVGKKVSKHLFCSSLYIYLLILTLSLCLYIYRERERGGGGGGGGGGGFYRCFASIIVFIHLYITQSWTIIFLFHTKYMYFVLSYSIDVDSTLSLELLYMYLQHCTVEQHFSELTANTFNCKQNSPVLVVP